MTMTQENWSNQSRACPSATLSTTNPTTSGLESNLHPCAPTDWRL